MKSVLLLFLLINSFTGSESAVSQGKMRVNSYRVSCHGFIFQQCLQIQEGDAIGSDTWSNFYDSIEGFDYEEGYIYDLVVEYMDRPGPPIMDASSIIVTLISLDRKIKGNLELNIDRDECDYRHKDALQLTANNNIDNTVITVGQYIEIEFWFKLNSQCTATWCNILHIGDKNVDTRLPGIWINGQHKVFMFVMGNDVEGANPRSDVWNPRFDITLDGIEHLFYLKFNDQQKIVMIDGIPYNRNINDYYPNTNFQDSYPLYLSDPWYPAADMTLRDICIYSKNEPPQTVQNEHICIETVGSEYSYLNGGYTQYPQKAKDLEILFYFKKNQHNSCSGEGAKNYYIWNWNDDNPKWGITTHIGEYFVASCDVSGAPIINNLFECNGNWIDYNNGNTPSFTIRSGECEIDEIPILCIGDTNVFSNTFQMISIPILVSSICTIFALILICCYYIGHQNGLKRLNYIKVSKIDNI